MDVGNVFAGQARRMAHRDRQRTVDVRAGRGVDNVAEAHRARCALGGMRGAEESIEGFESARAGEADNRNGADAGGGGGGDYRVGGVHGNTIVVEPTVSYHTSLGRGDPCTRGFRERESRNVADDILLSGSGRSEYRSRMTQGMGSALDDTRTGILRSADSTLE